MNINIPSLKQKLQCTLPLVLLFTSSFAQVTVFQQRAAGGSKTETLATCFQTIDGGMIAGGSSNSDISGNKSESSRGESDYWVIKYDSVGNIIWDKTFGGDRNDFLTIVKQTKDNGYILGGTSFSGVSGDKTEGSKDNPALADGGDFWLVKVDKNGNKQWDKTLGGNLMDSLASVQQTADGGYVIGGYSRSAATGNKSENNRGKEDYWIIKVSKNGTIEWDRTLGGSGSDRLVSVHETANGEFILGGNSNSKMGNEKTENSYGKVDYWILQLNAAGVVVWDKTIGGNGVETGGDFQQMADGGYIVSGSSNSTISGLKTQKNRGSSNTTFDYWIVRLDAEHNIIWDRTFGGDKDDMLTSAIQTSDKGYILCGYSNSGKFGEKSEDNIGGFDFWIVKMHDGSRIHKDKTLGGFDNDFGVSVAEANYREFWVGGYSSSAVSGNKTADSHGKSDYWMVYLRDESILPVSFTNVKAYQHDNGVKVLWTSLSELNVAKYEIQRSSDAVNFKIAGVITPSSNAAKQVNYNYFDQYPVNGSNYYRIKAVDLDGKETITSAVLVIIKGKAEMVVYPNPVKDVLNVRVTGKASLSLVNQQGNVVLVKTIENNASISVSGLSSGVYYLRNDVSGEKIRVLINR